MVALGAVLVRRGHPAAGLATMVTRVVANVLSASALGVAAFAQPAIGRNYLAHHTAEARLLIKTAANGGPLNAVIVISGVLLIASAVVAGVGVARGPAAAPGRRDRLCGLDDAVCDRPNPRHGALAGHRRRPDDRLHRMDRRRRRTPRCTSPSQRR
jgi:hypothetical protein